MVIAHISKDRRVQTLRTHLLSTAERMEKSAEKFGLEKLGRLIGLLHDVGKYSKVFQLYIQEVTKDEDQDGEQVTGSRRKVDHSTAGAQLFWELAPLSGLKQSPAWVIAREIVFLVLASHHSGLIDCVNMDGGDILNRRIRKPLNETNLGEVKSVIDADVYEQIKELVADPDLLSPLINMLKCLPGGTTEEARKLRFLKMGFVARMLLSCLIDADHSDTADFMHPEKTSLRQYGDFASWEILGERLEKHLQGFSETDYISRQRSMVSNACYEAGKKKMGIYTLTVPTGGGKTLSSLRFALQHAISHDTPNEWVERIFYITPFTTIIDQNARTVREALETDEDRGQIVLEHHTNIVPENDTWRNKILSENWDAPVVFTTNVQFLQSCFAAGTQSARRMHQLAHSIIVFDEIQTLPINCVHLFCNMVRFLVDSCGCTIVLCTATQPLLNRVNPEYGAIDSSEEIIPDPASLFKALERVKVENACRNEGWSNEEIVDLILDETRAMNSCMLVVNTTKTARSIYRKLAKEIKGRSANRKIRLFHLSARMCPTHRMSILRKMREALADIECAKADGFETATVICISTQVIEAGVDIDFALVIRSLAGLDSIAQAAGRCNRNGRLPYGRMVILNIKDEDVTMLSAIKTGQEKAKRIFREYEQQSVLSLEAMNTYFSYYFFERAKDMRYPLRVGGAFLQELLSANGPGYRAYVSCTGMKTLPTVLCQAFQTAANQFRAIESKTQSVIVPYSEEGKVLITNLCGADAENNSGELLRKAQQFSVSLFEGTFEQLRVSGALHRIAIGEGIYYLDSQFYDDDCGVDSAPEEMPF